MTYLDFCVQVQSNDPSILPEPGEPFKIYNALSDKENIELSNALLENTKVTYLQLWTENYCKSSAEAMAKYVRTSKRLQRIEMLQNWMRTDRAFEHHEEMLCCFLLAFQSTSLKELNIHLPLLDGPSNLALENMLTHTQSLRSLRLFWPDDLSEDRAMAAASSGLKSNTTLQELTLEGATAVSPILTSLRNHPHLRRLCLIGYVEDLTGLETVLLSDTSQIRELEIHTTRFGEAPPTSMIGLTRVLEALARRPTLTKLGLRTYYSSWSQRCDTAPAGIV